MRATNSPARKWRSAAITWSKRDYTGAINRFKTVVTRYQTTRHVEEALARLTEAYMAIGIVGEAQTAAAVLGHNFPDSRWYKDAYNLVKSGGVEPSRESGLMDEQGVQEDGAWLAIGRSFPDPKFAKVYALLPGGPSGI